MSEMKARPDVAILGGGVVGVAAALELRQRGLSVSVLEKDRIGHGCSYGNAGWLTPSLCLPLPAPGLLWKATKWLFDPESPLYIQPRLDPGLLRWLAGFVLSMRQDKFERGAAAIIEMCRASVDAWEALAAKAPEPFGYARLGHLSIYETRKAFEAARANVELVGRCGVRHEFWSAEKVRELEPAVTGAQIGAYYFPDDAHVEPYPAVRALAAEARRAGVEFIESAEIFGMQAEGGAISKLNTTRGDFRAGTYVLATGAWSERLAKKLGLRVPVLGAKGYSLVLPRLEPHPTRSLHLAERKIAVNPHQDALRISGTLELVDEDLSITHRRVQAIARAAKGMLPLPEPLEVRELWRGLRPCTPDGMPMIGRARGLGNLWLSTGHQMVGLKTAPASARLLADLMTGCAPSYDPQPFRPDRY